MVYSAEYGCFVGKMPLKVFKRKFKDGNESEHFWCRGTVEGREIFRTTKRTGKRDAQKWADQLEEQIKSQIRSARDLENERLFFEALEAYRKKGKDLQYLPEINKRLGMTPLRDIDQVIIDRTAREAYPHQSNSSVRRWYYDPVCTIMNYAAHTLKWCAPIKIKKPEPNYVAPKWAEFEWFEIVWQHCSPEFNAFSILLSESGARAGEALSLTAGSVNLHEKWAYVPKTKNQEPRMIYLTDATVTALMLVMPEEGKIFPWKDHRAVNTYVKRLVERINKARLKEKKPPIEYLSTHKFGSHTYATLGRRYLNMDETSLTNTGRWKDPRSVKKYLHTNIREEAPRAEGFATARRSVRAKSVQSGRKRQKT